MQIVIYEWDFRVFLDFTHTTIAILYIILPYYIFGNTLFAEFIKSFFFIYSVIMSGHEIGRAHV